MSNGQVRRVEVQTGKTVESNATAFQIKNLSSKTLEGAAVKDDLLVQSKQEDYGETVIDHGKVKKAVSKFFNLEDSDNQDIANFLSAFAPEFNLLLIAAPTAIPFGSGGPGTGGYTLLAYEQVGDDLVFLDSEFVQVDAPEMQLAYSGQDGVFFISVNSGFASNFLRRVNYDSGTKTFTHVEVTAALPTGTISGIILSNVPDSNVVGMVVSYNQSGTEYLDARFFAADPADSSAIIWQNDYFNIITGPAFNYRAMVVSKSIYNTNAAYVMHFVFTSAGDSNTQMTRLQIKADFSGPIDGVFVFQGDEIVAGQTPNSVQSLLIGKDKNAVLFTFDLMGSINISFAKTFAIISYDSSSRSEFIEFPLFMAGSNVNSGQMAYAPQGDMIMFYSRPAPVGASLSDPWPAKVYFAKYKDFTLEFFDHYTEIENEDYSGLGTAWYNPNTMNFGFSNANPSADLVENIGFNHGIISNPASVAGLLGESAENEQVGIDLGPSVTVLTNPIETDENTLFGSPVYKAFDGAYTTDSKNAVFKVGYFIDNDKILFER